MRGPSILFAAIGAAVGGAIGAQLEAGFWTGALIGGVLGAAARALSGTARVPPSSGGTVPEPTVKETTPVLPDRPRPWKRGQTIAGLFGDALVITDIKGGGMGVVLLCYGVRMGRAVVLKTYADDVDFARDDFRREAENWVRLGRHPNVVRAHALIERDQRIYIGTELVPRHPRHGTDLHEWIHSGGLDPELTLDLAVQICRGMEHAAACFPHGFVHRDLKPSNVLVHPDGRAMITDFGISRSLPPDRILRSGRRATLDPSDPGATAMKGTPTIMSPEQWTVGGTLDARSDVYSFGCVLFEMLTRRPVFMAPEVVQLGYQHRAEEPPRPRDLRRDVPEALERIVLRCLRKKPDDRYPDFRALRADLELLAGAKAPPAAPAPPETATSLINRAHDLLILRRAAEALNLLNRAMVAEPRNESVWINRGAARGMLGDLVGELEDLSKAIELEPRSYVAWRNRARVRMKTGDFENALRDFREANGLLPPGFDPALGPRDRGNLHFQVGCLKLFEGDAAGAEEALSEALREDPDHPEAQALRSQAKLGRGDAAAAMEDLDQAIALHPDGAVGWAFRAHVKIQIGVFEGAARDASEAIRLDAAFPLAFNNRAAARFNLKDFTGCIADCDESIRLMPKLSMPHLNRANALLELRELAEAREAYQRALSLGLPAPWDAVANAGLRFIDEGGGR